MFRTLLLGKIIPKASLILLSTPIPIVAPPRGLTSEYPDSCNLIVEDESDIALTDKEKSRSSTLLICVWSRIVYPILLTK